MDELGFDRYSVVGSSYGGLLAALLALALPRRVLSLVVVGSASAFHPTADQVESLRAAAANAQAVMADPTSDAWRERLARICFRPESIPEATLLAQLTAYALPDRLQAYMATVEGLLTEEGLGVHRVIDRLEEIRVRTLIITGRDDIRSAWRHAVTAQRRIPDCRIEIYEQCGHLPHCEHPDRFNRDVAGFLGGKDAPQLGRSGSGSVGHRGHG
jgi:pimeloyl-ACP methyl ester carboxylesterase